MIETQSLHRRYLTYLLLFYCVAITLYCWFPLLSSTRTRCSLTSQTSFPSQQDHQNTTSPHSQNNSSTPGFPRRIWQTARTNLPTLDSQTQSSIQTWMDKHPSHIYTLITASRGRSYVRENYSHRPSLVSDFLSLRDDMLRADLVQYLFLLHDGGTYTDLDTKCLKPISDWIPSQFNPADIGLTLGIEGDSLGGEIISGFSHPVQFATWTMAVKPNHPMIEMIIERVLTQLHSLAERQNTTISGIEAGYMDVMDTTGPGVFAESIYAGLSLITNSPVSSANLTGMTAPRVFGDVLVLPITSFGAGIGHSNAGGIEDEMALVQHMFAGTWKGDHPLGGSKGLGEGAVEVVEEVHQAGTSEPEDVPGLPELQEADEASRGEELRGMKGNRGRRRRRDSLES